MVADDFVAKHRLRTKRALDPEPIKGVHGTPFTAKYKCSITLRSRISVFELSIVAEVVPSDAVAYQIRGASVSQKFWKLVDVPLAETAFYQDRLDIPKVDILLGAEYYEIIVLNETRSYEDVMLRSTHFGWTVTGKMRYLENSKKGTKSKFCNLTIQDVQEQLEAFMRMEEPPKTKEVTNVDATEQEMEECELVLANEDRLLCPLGMEQAQFCVTHFERTHVRINNAQFSVRLPFISDPADSLLCNRKEAVNNLLFTERKREKVQSQYCDFMKEYEEMGYMSEVQDQNEKPAAYFIPHRAVIRPMSTTTSTRVVFNASSKTRSSQSLNEVLAIGPSIQPELFDTLIRFRTFECAFCADIAKMYRCVLLDYRDRKFQHILWRPSKAESIKEYELNTVTYGTGPASFMATMCLEMLAREVESSRPRSRRSS